MVGLGNPGERYRRTRHNAGFMAVDVLAARTRAAGRVIGDAWVAEASLAGGDRPARQAPLVHEREAAAPSPGCSPRTGARPRTSWSSWTTWPWSSASIRVRERGSHGGHNGLRSLGESLGTEDFARVRIGVRRGELPADLAEYVLADFEPDEVLLVQEAVGLAADAVTCLLEDGPTVAMNRFNGRRP